MGYRILLRVETCLCVTFPILPVVRTGLVVTVSQKHQPANRLDPINTSAYGSPLITTCSCMSMLCKDTASFPLSPFPKPCFFHVFGAVTGFGGVGVARSFLGELTAAFPCFLALTLQENTSSQST
jgi:hypothetical protein